MDNLKKWDAHWKSLSKEKKRFSNFLSFYRKYIISNLVAHYLNKYFPKNGVFIECGSGTSQTSSKINKEKRTFLALDYSYEALKLAKEEKNIDSCINADILNLPFKNNVIDGIWNLGVMEHFTDKELRKAIDEFSRVLKKDSYLIMFWPPKKGLYHFSTDLIEKTSKKMFRKEIDLFPDEINLFDSKKHNKEIFIKSKFSNFKIINFSLRDFFMYSIVICKK